MISEKIRRIAAGYIISVARLPLTEERRTNVLHLFTAIEAAHITDTNQIAYVLATVAHECGFRSIREIRAKKGTTVYRMQQAYWDTGYFGRGFPQLTWKKNYEKFEKLLNQPLVNNPDLVLDPEIGAKILCIGMRDGLFTGKRLSDYIPTGGKPDFMNARRIVNGTFMADKVAEKAEQIYLLLEK